MRVPRSPAKVPHAPRLHESQRGATKVSLLEGEAALTAAPLFPQRHIIGQRMHSMPYIINARRSMARPNILETVIDPDMKISTAVTHIDPLNLVHCPECRARQSGVHPPDVVQLRLSQQSYRWSISHHVIFVLS